MARYQLLVLVDNSAPHPTSMIAEYGFSLLLEDMEADKLILFDTGSSGTVLLYNMEQAGIDPRDIDYLVLSHRHYDHTGGLIKFLEARKGKPIDVIAHPDLYTPAYTNLLGGVLRNIGIPFPQGKLESLGARLLLARTSIQITDGIITSGEIPRKWGPEHTEGMLRLENGELKEDEILDDNALYVKTSRGLLVVTGCGHAGVENIVKYGLETMEIDKLYGVIGGLHLLGASSNRLAAVAEFLASKNPEMVAAMHCTGPLAQYLLREKLGSSYRLAGVGFKTKI